MSISNLELEEEIQEVIDSVGEIQQSHIRLIIESHGLTEEKERVQKIMDKFDKDIGE